MKMDYKTIPSKNLLGGELLGKTGGPSTNSLYGLGENLHVAGMARKSGYEIPKLSPG